ncbi:MAG: hypothetical protein Q9227_002179 [Pyrenula ochraceoflavens]
MALRTSQLAPSLAVLDGGSTHAPVESPPVTSISTTSVSRSSAFPSAAKSPDMPATLRPLAGAMAGAPEYGPNTSENRVAMFAGLESLLVAIVVITILLRLYTRLLVVRRAGLDDALMTMASVLTLVMCIACFLALGNGLGYHETWLAKHQHDIDITERKHSIILQLAICAVTSHMTALALAKASIIVSYLRIFTVHKWFTLLIHRIGIMVLFGTGLLSAAATSVRVTQIQYIRAPDFTYKIVPFFLCCAADLAVCIVCGSIPCLRPLFARFRPRRSSPVSSATKMNSRATKLKTMLTMRSRIGTPPIPPIEIQKTTKTDLDSDVWAGDEDHAASYRWCIEAGADPNNTWVIDGGNKITTHPPDGIRPGCKHHRPHHPDDDSDSHSDDLKVEPYNITVVSRV